MWLLLLLLAACGPKTLLSPRAADWFVVPPDAYTQTETGLRTLDIVTGLGAQALPGHEVTVHYTGWLRDGTRFDSSFDRGQPLVFALGQGRVIKGWEEGVAGMRVGGQRQLVIPPELGYGARAAGPIPPGSTLVFEVSLLDVSP